MNVFYQFTATVGRKLEGKLQKCGIQSQEKNILIFSKHFFFFTFMPYTYKYTIYYPIITKLDQIMQTLTKYNPKISGKKITRDD